MYVLDIAVPEDMESHQYLGMYSVSFDSLNSLLQPVMHGSICDNPLRFVLAEMCGDRPSLHLPDRAYVARRPLEALRPVTMS